MNSSAKDFLLSTQNPDGGWGYAAGEASIVEPTATVALALTDASVDAEACRRALAWLHATQHRDGGWGIGAEDRESGWQTAWALLVLAREVSTKDAIDRAIGWLVGVQSQRLNQDPMQIDLQKRLLDIDVTLRAWPWLPGQATWVEPTALAMLALAEVPSAPAVEARIGEAVRYLEDRRCAGGGWNVGNPTMLGAHLPPRAHATAWVLLALARLAPAAITPQDSGALQADMKGDGGALALGWGLLALHALGQDDAAAAERQASLQGVDGGWNGNPYHTAIALLAERGRL